MSKRTADAGNAQPADTPFDRLMRFETALFAVKKDQFPKREESAKPPLRLKHMPKHTPKPTP